MKTHRLFAQWRLAAFSLQILIGVICFLLTGCHPGFVSDRALKSRFFHHRADFNELIQLFNPQPEKEICAHYHNYDPPKPLHPSPDWIKIQNLLRKLDAVFITKFNEKGKKETDVLIKIADADLLNGRYYYFVYRLTPPHGLVPSLYGAYPYDHARDYFMKMDENWYASVYEDN